MIKVEALIHSRHLVVETVIDAKSEVALSPFDMLTLKSKVVMPPPGVFGILDLYCKKHWRQVQHINKFWSRWFKEFWATLQERQKQLLSKRSFRVGDILILKEVSNQNEWKLAKVIDVYNDENGHVQSVQLYVGASDPDQLLTF